MFVRLLVEIRATLQAIVASLGGRHYEWTYINYIDIMTLAFADVGASLNKLLEFRN